MLQALLSSFISCSQTTEQKFDIKIDLTKSKINVDAEKYLESLNNKIIQHINEENNDNEDMMNNNKCDSSEQNNMKKENEKVKESEHNIEIEIENKEEKKEDEEIAKTRNQQKLKSKRKDDGEESNSDDTEKEMALNKEENINSPPNKNNKNSNLKNSVKDNESLKNSQGLFGSNLGGSCLKDSVGVKNLKSGRSNISSNDENYSLKPSNMKNIKIEMNKGLLFTIKENEQENIKDGYLEKKVFWMKNIVILDQEIEANPKYVVSDTVDSDLLYKKELIITAAGIENGLRRVRDGYTFFGIHESYNGCIINDYLLNLPSEYREKCTKRLFVIFFERSNSKFYFRSLRESEIFIYVKIKKNFILNKKRYFQIGDIIFHTELINNNIKLVVHNEDLEQSNEKNKEYLFDKYREEILIGRSERCNIKFDHIIISKIHCIIQYNKQKNLWTLSDGNGERKSTNGTWLFCNSKYELGDSITYAKIGKNIISIKKM